MDRDQTDIAGAKRYQQMVRDNAPKPKWGRDLFRAFLVGGSITFIGQFVFQFFQGVERTQGEGIATTLAVMIILGAIATGLGFYDKLGDWGGMGAAVPITGFANTIVAAAMDFRREGLLVGMGSKMFVIAGPVLVFGIVAGFVVGLIRGAIAGDFP